MAEETKPTKAEPKDASGHALVKSILAAVPGSVIKSTDFVGELTVEIPTNQLVAVAEHLKQGEKFDYLVEIFAIDYMNWKDWSGDRFAVHYVLYSHPKNIRIRLRVTVPDGRAVPTVTGLWRAANWPEREVWDMHGIPFDGHPELERILTWEGFNGHPLRKDFPVEGIDTGAAIYPEIWPTGGGPPEKDPNRKTVS